MAKQITKLVDLVEQAAQDIEMQVEDLTLSLHVHNQGPTGMKTGHIRLSLADVMEAVAIINTRINKVSKLDKRLAKLE